MRPFVASAERASRQSEQGYGRSMTCRAVVAAVLAMVGVDASTAASATAAAPGTPITVSFTDVPAALNLVPYATVPIPADADAGAADLPEVAVLADGGAVLVDDRSATAFLVGRDGSVSSVPLEVVPRFVVATPGPVVYGLAETSDARGLEFVAVALMGANAGRVVARQPVADPSQYLELPIGAFGNATGGVVDRVRAPGTVMIGHVDVGGAPVGYPAGPLWRLDEDGVVSDGATTWSLDIERNAGWTPPLAGESPAAPTTGGGGVYWTTLGPPDGSGGPEPTMPVIVVLSRDGSGSWHSIPTDWHPASSDTGGTIFARRVGDTVELARLADDLANPRPCPEYEVNVAYPL